MSHSVSKIEVAIATFALFIIFCLSHTYVYGQGRTQETANIALCGNNLKTLCIGLHDYYVTKGRKRYYPNYSKTEYKALGVEPASKTDGLKFVEFMFMGRNPIFKNSDFLSCPSNNTHMPNKYKLSDDKNFDIGQSAYLFRNTAAGYTLKPGRGAEKSPVASDRAKNHTGFNVVFLDGHVEWFGDETTWHYKDADDVDSPLLDKPYKEEKKKSQEENKSSDEKEKSEKKSGQKSNKKKEEPGSAKSTKKKKDKDAPKELLVP